VRERIRFSGDERFCYHIAATGENFRLHPLFFLLKSMHVCCIDDGNRRMAVEKMVSVQWVVRSGVY